MDNNNLICIYDDTKEDLNTLLSDIFAHFIENELRNIENI